MGQNIMATSPAGGFIPNAVSGLRWLGIVSPLLRRVCAFTQVKVGRGQVSGFEEVQTEVEQERASQPATS